MTSALTIGLDVGTTSLKGVVLDPDAGIIAAASRPNDLTSSRPGWAEASPAQWRANAAEVLAELAAAVGPDRVGAIATSGMVPAVVAVDSGGEPVRPAILQNDARASREVAAIAAEISHLDVLGRTGSPVSQQSVAPTARWLATHEPDAWARVDRVVGSYDWLLMSLGARAHVEENWALESGLFTIEGDAFDPAVDAGGLLGRLADVAHPGQIVGELRRDAAEAAGLPIGIPLVVGGADHVLSAVGAGLDRPGDWLVKLGGAGDLLAISTDPVVDERFYLDRHPRPGLWMPNGCMATSGSLVRWVQQLLAIDDLAAMDVEAQSRPAADLLVLPYFLGEKSPLNDADLRGVIAGLHLGHGRADLYRAALEGIAFGFRHNAEVLRDRGVVLHSASVTNGGATSQLWKRIHASVLDVPLATVRDHPGAALGAAVAAAIAIGALDGWGDVRSLVRPGTTVDPDPDLVDRYDEAYRLWRQLGDVTATTMRSLARR